MNATPRGGGGGGGVGGEIIGRLEGWSSPSTPLVFVVDTLMNVV